MTVYDEEGIDRKTSNGSVIVSLKAQFMTLILWPKGNPKQYDIRRNKNHTHYGPILSKSALFICI